jgi:hypothetical protein
MTQNNAAQKPVAPATAWFGSAPRLSSASAAQTAATIAATSATAIASAIHRDQDEALPRAVATSRWRMHEPANEDTRDRPHERDERDHDDQLDDHLGRVVTEAITPPARGDAEDQERVADGDRDEDPPAPHEGADREADGEN